MINFSNLIDYFETAGSYTVTRKGAPVYVDGRLSSPSSSTFSIDASVQPLTGKDTQLLPEGARTDNTKVLYTTTLLNTVEDNEPDVVSVSSVDYEVFNVEEWVGFGDTYYRCLIRKVA